MSHIYINEVKVGNILVALDKSKTPGNDGIHPHVLQKCAASMAKPLSLIFKKSLESGLVPSSWREANITHLFKKGSKLDAANYRPVSLTSVPCKVMEKLIRNYVLSHLTDNNLINNKQHGFVPGKSCTTNLLETLDILTNILDKGKSADVLYMDMAKAFDKVSHRRLSFKLSAYGIIGDVLTWITQFLSNRRQRVVLGKVMSDWLPVLSGVPQGSVLGPLLFVIFVNDLPDIFQNHCRLYADDNKLIAPISQNISSYHDVQTDIDSMTEWCSKWLMNLKVYRHVANYIPKCSLLYSNQLCNIYHIKMLYLSHDICVYTEQKYYKTPGILRFV